jgi:hypothetical protein
LRLRKVEDLVERLPAVISTGGVAFLVTYMVVGGHEDANRVFL